MTWWRRLFIDRLLYSYTPRHERSNLFRICRLTVATATRPRCPHFVPFSIALWHAYSAKQAIYSMIILYLKKLNKQVSVWFIDVVAQTYWHTTLNIRYNTYYTTIPTFNDCDRAMSVCKIGGDTRIWKRFGRDTGCLSRGAKYSYL